MRINLQPGAQEQIRTEPAVPRSSQGGSAHQSSASGSLGEDQADLSGAHTQIQALAAQAAQLPEIREARVEALRQAIQGGNYRPNPEHVANAILGHMAVTSVA